jgi:hypothetical protein
MVSPEQTGRRRVGLRYSVAQCAVRSVPARRAAPIGARRFAAHGGLPNAEVHDVIGSRRTPPPFGRRCVQQATSLSWRRHMLITDRTNAKRMGGRSARTPHGRNAVTLWCRHAFPPTGSRIKHCLRRVCPRLIRGETRGFTAGAYLRLVTISPRATVGAHRRLTGSRANPFDACVDLQVAP